MSLHAWVGLTATLYLDHSTTFCLDLQRAQTGYPCSFSTTPCETRSEVRSPATTLVRRTSCLRGQGRKGTCGARSLDLNRPLVAGPRRPPRPTLWAPLSRVACRFKRQMAGCFNARATTSHCRLLRSCVTLAANPRLRRVACRLDPQTAVHSAVHFLGGKCGCDLQLARQIERALCNGIAWVCWMQTNMCYLQLHVQHNVHRGRAGTPITTVRTAPATFACVAPTHRACYLHATSSPAAVDIRASVRAVTSATHRVLLRRNG